MRLQQLNRLKELRKEAEQFRTNQISDQEINEYEELWEGEYDVTGAMLPVPTLVSDAQRQLAGLVGGEPQVEITTSVPEKVAGARVNTIKQNHLIRQLKLMDQIADAGQDAVTIGTGLLLDGFGSQFGIHYNTSEQGFDHTRRDEDGERIEYHDDIYDNLPWTLRIHLTNFLVPANTVRIADATGMWIRYIRHIDDVRADEKLIKKHRMKIKPDACYCDAERNTDSDLEEDYVVLWDYYDLKTNHRVTFNEEYPYALQDEVDELLIRLDRLPIHVIIFNKNSRKFYGTPDFRLLMPLAEEINDIRTMQMRLRHLEVVKGFYDKRMLEGDDDMEAYEKAIEDMTSDEAMALIGINGDPRSFINSWAPSQPYDLVPQIELAKDEIEQFGLGIGKTQKGLMAEGRHTAFETKVTEGHHDQSMAPRRKVIATTVTDVVMNWSKLLFDFQIEPDVAKTHDAAGRPVTVEYTGQDIRGSYDYKVSLQSLKAKSQEDKISEANMILEQSQQFIEAGIVNPQSLFSQWLTRIGSSWDTDSLMMQQAPPQAPPMPFDQFQQGFMQPPPPGPQGMPQIPQRPMMPMPQRGGPQR